MPSIFDLVEKIVARNFTKQQNLTSKFSNILTNVYLLSNCVSLCNALVALNDKIDICVNYKWDC